MGYIEELREKNKKEFIRKMNEKFGDKFDTSNINYVNKRTKITLECPTHGSFESTPETILRGFGCPKCGFESGSKKRSITIDKFIERSNLIHNGKYDYSKSNVENLESNVEIICHEKDENGLEHGSFFQQALYHLHGYGCPKCSNTSRSKKLIKTLEAFIKEAKKVHGDKYIYDESEYKGANVKTTIICKIHGKFEQEPHNHLRGAGCPYCANKNKTTEDFIVKAKSVHGDKYDYSESKYEAALKKIKIICPKHGEFWQTPLNHVNGHGCPKCSVSKSKWELEVFEFIKSLGLECEQSDRKVLDGHEIDILIPSLNVGIECDGLRWHSSEFRESNYHINKTKNAFKKGIRLIHIFEDEWLNYREVCEAMLKSILGKEINHIKIEDSFVEEISYDEMKKFMKENSFSFCDEKCSYCLGVKDKHNGDLLFVIGMNYVFERNYTSNNFCSKLGYRIDEPLKMIADFMFKQLVDSFSLFLDKRWYNGYDLKSSNFSFNGSTEEKGYYVSGVKRIEITENLNLPKISDCGCDIWIL